MVRQILSDDSVNVRKVLMMLGLTNTATMHYRLRSQPPYVDNAVDFFRDCPWLKIPTHHRGEIIVEPLLPPGGLAGGSSSGEGKGKVSKLAALAAARKKKEERNCEEDKELQEYTERASYGAVGLLDRLSNSRIRRPLKDEGSSVNISSELKNDRLHREILTRGYISRKERAQAVQLDLEAIEALENSDNEAKISIEIDLKAHPSAFATIITGEPSHHTVLGSGTPVGGPITIPYLAELNETEYTAFIGPSPDDVVTSAQRGKGESALRMTWELDLR